MKQNFRITLRPVRIGLTLLTLAIAAMSLISFTEKKFYEDVFSKLGLTRDQANARITEGLLNGYLNHYGIRNLKSIALNDRGAIVKDLASYAREQAATPAFKTAYLKIKESNKPTAPQKMQTADELRAGMVKSLTDNITKFEAELKTATAQMKPIYQNMLVESKKQLKEYQDPNNAMLKMYADNFKESESIQKEAYQNQLNAWEEKYPANPIFYVKLKLQEFLEATEGVDFNAATVEKNGKKYFTNPSYERKSSNWKMAFRAGKPAVDAGRAFAKEWIAEISK
ncbi:MAG: hypothetical protein H7Y27_01805 [Gemmatimonadaceae bacterium]|nr:hypothetical protein [Chitinophagaceae bacterium]